MTECCHGRQMRGADGDHAVLVRERRCEFNTRFVEQRQRQKVLGGRCKEGHRTTSAGEGTVGGKA